ncbi:protein-tyrosine-phosphatase [Streptomyces albidoflavus]|uniref:tyrosine-protein phosphatase n=1 Tax=Streptomyces albidoflavus TaxID=1886 RepID=UPI00101E5CF7|nr:tyrosine-protein phosphatase [Streptomyces albidoflavus]RZE05370.1 protein-tyrosine-phosphatase [Streptomyces albidoflavus]RZE06291.1 protein-tyrosine-phosphatase [Streptomyces albidoflavus]
MTAAAPPDPHTRRHLTWDGCFNVRDLGGLGRHAPGAFVRADSVEKLTAAGWAAAHAHGVRTVLDLRNDDEQGADAAPRPDGITTVRLPLEDIEDTAFWEPWFTDWRWGTPLHYRPFLDHFPERVAATAEALAAAAPGGVAFHCAAGRDRTGLVSLLLLSLAGATPEEIAADYALSEARMTPVFTALGRAEEAAQLAAAYRSHATSPYAEMLKVARRFDGAAYLAAAGVPGTTVAALRARATGQPQG